MPSWILDLNPTETLLHDQKQAQVGHHTITHKLKLWIEEQVQTTVQDSSDTETVCLKLLTVKEIQLLTKYEDSHIFHP